MARKRYIQKIIDGKSRFVEVSENYRPEPSAPAILGDIQPYRSMVTGEMITSRSRHRAHLKDHGMIEIGNDIDAACKKPELKMDRKERKRLIVDVVNSKL